MSQSSGDARTRRLAAVWFADIRGYTALSSRDEDAALAVVDVFQSLAREHVNAHGGRVVKFIGDAVMAVFESAEAALRAALAFREAFMAHETVRRHGVALRVGVHLGEVVEADDGDVYGDGVNTASRVEGAAAPGQIAVTRAVYQQIRNRKGFHAWALGARRLKGISEPLPLYEVSLTPPTEEQLRTAKRLAAAPQSRVYRRATALGIGTSVVAFGVLMFSVATRPADPPEEGATEGASNVSAETAGTDSAAPAAVASGDPAAETSAGEEPEADEPAAGGDETPSAAARPPRPTWSVREGVDPISDAASVTLSITSAEGVAVRITCARRATEVTVRWPAPLAEASLTVRADDGRPRTERWALSADSAAATYRGDGRRLLREWERASSLALRAETRSGPVTAVLPMESLPAALDRAGRACG